MSPVSKVSKVNTSVAAVSNGNEGVSNYFTVLGNAKEAIGGVFGVATGAIKSATVNPVESLLGRELTDYEKAAVYLGALGVGVLAVNASGLLNLGGVVAAVDEAPSFYVINEEVMQDAVKGLVGYFGFMLDASDFNVRESNVQYIMNGLLECMENRDHRSFVDQCIKGIKNLSGDDKIKKEIIGYLEGLTVSG